MVRPCFLVLDREHSGNISTRKLSIETAKFNVMTAYSSQEAIATLERNPALDGVVMDAASPDLACDDLVSSLKAVNPKIPVIVVRSPHSALPCDKADHLLSSFNPRRLLAILQGMFPAETAAIEKRNEALEEEGDD